MKFSKKNASMNFHEKLCMNEFIHTHKREYINCSISMHGSQMKDATAYVRTVQMICFALPHSSSPTVSSIWSTVHVTTCTAAVATNMGMAASRVLSVGETRAPNASTAASYLKID
jgi:hypothetical protein